MKHRQLTPTEVEEARKSFEEDYCQPHLSVKNPKAPHLERTAQGGYFKMTTQNSWSTFIRAWQLAMEKATKETSV